MAKDLKIIFGEMHGLDQKSVDTLTRALNNANLPGFDYLEFKQSLGALQRMNMDEPTSIKSAFVTAQTMGLTKNKLIETAQHYKSILAGEMNKFQQAMDSRVKARVEGKKLEIERLKKQVSDYKEKIQQLESQIEKHQATIDSADSTIQSEVTKIQNIHRNFEQAHQSLLNQIDKDILNIRENL
ncbi:MAG: hypothetical protein AB8F74_13470 [Saprospiraceae bacterium]